MSHVIKVNKGRLPLVLGLGGNNTLSLVQQLQESDLSHFSAILSVSPYYNRPSQEGIYQHYRQLSLASPIPIIMYNIPYRTGTNMEPETVFRLANDCKNIIGLKEAAGSFDQILLLLNGKPKDFMIISGEDSLALSLGLTVVVGLSYSLLDQTNLISFDAEIGNLVLFVGVTYLITLLINRKRYQ